MKTISIGQTIFSGSAIKIVKKMQRMAFIPRMLMNDYIQYVVGEYERLSGISLHITGGTTKERAESLVEEMCRTGIAQRAQ